MATIKKIYHADHGVSPETIQQIIDRLEEDKKLPAGFFIITTRLPLLAPSIENALYGPRSGDDDVTESEVFYMKRSEDRPPSRMVNLPARETRKVTVIGMNDPDGVNVYTIYGGPAAEREPGDPTLTTPEEKQAAIDFWAVHALAAR